MSRSYMYRFQIFSAKIANNLHYSKKLDVNLNNRLYCRHDNYISELLDWWI